jgi:O-antigen/teichoic acid export membrane protein
VGLVHFGFGLRGAIVGAVSSTALELVAARFAIRPSLRHASVGTLSRRFHRLSAPLFVHGLSIQLFQRLGLLLLVPFGATTAEAGLYGAADSLLRIRRVLGQSLTPLVLGALTGLRRDGDEPGARRLAVAGLRLSVLTAVPVGAAAGAATPLMAWLFGPRFADGGDALALLVWGAPAFVVISVASAVLVSAGRAGATALLPVMALPVAAAAYALAVPRFGPLGAASVTSAVGLLLAGAFVAAAARLARVALPAATPLRAAFATAVAFAVARLVPGQGFALLATLPLAVATGVATLFLTGEVRRGEIASLRESIRSSRTAGREGGSATALDDPA